MDNISAETALAILGAIGTAYGLYSAWKNNIKKDNEEISNMKEQHDKELTDIKMDNVTVLANINKELTSINLRQEQQCTQLTEMQADIKSTKNDLREVREEQIIQRTEIKAIWKNIDQLKESKKKEG